MAKFYADEHRASKSKREIERESNSSAASATAAIRAPFMATVDLSTCGCLRQRRGLKRAGKEENEQTALLNSSGCWLSGLSLVSCGLAQIRQRQQQR